MTKRIFRAKIPADLILAIYKYEGWTRAYGESATKRVAEAFNVTTDHRQGYYVATRKEDKNAG